MIALEQFCNDGIEEGGHGVGDWAVISAPPP
jgi:hypothetical protein